MRNSNHQPWSKTETVVWTLRKEITQMVRMASARMDLDPDVIAERAIEMMLSPDGKTKTQRRIEKADARQRESESRTRRLTLSADERVVSAGEYKDADEATDIEIQRLLKLVGQ